MNIKKSVASLLVAATLAGTSSAPVSAAPISTVEAGTEVTAIEENLDAVGGHAYGVITVDTLRQQVDGSDEIYKGKIVDFGSGQEVVMQVNEDGSFATMPFSLNSYSALAKSKCQHNQWEQIGIAKYQGMQWVRKKSICYNDIFRIKYKCKNPKCGLTREMTTYISYKHRYSKNTCTKCGMRKK